jgi:hypothetical protein
MKGAHERQWKTKPAEDGPNAAHPGEAFLRAQEPVDKSEGVL